LEWPNVLILCRVQVELVAHFVALWLETCNKEQQQQYRRPQPQQR
jgi:hypothetical protein